MLLNKIPIFILSFSLALSSLAGIDSIKDQIVNINGRDYRAKDVIRDIVRISKSKEPRHISPRLIPRDTGENPVRNEGTSEVCIECRDMTNFTSQISEIIQEYIETSPKEESIQLEQESFKLQAVLEYTKITDNKGRTHCLTDSFISNDAFYRPEIFEDLELMFTSKADLSQFHSMTISSKSQTESRITWFRAQDEAGTDIFIKVVNIKNKEPYFQVYQADKSFADPVAHRKTNLPKLEPPPEDEIIPRKSEHIFLEDKSYETRMGKVRINKALQLEQDYYIPTSLTLISMDTESKPTDDMVIRTSVELTDRDQEVSIGMDNKFGERYLLRSSLDIESSDQELGMQLDVDGKRRALAEVNADGTYRVGVTVGSPQFRNFDFETDISYDSSRTTRIQNNFRLNGSTIIQTGTIVAENGDFDFVAGRSFDVFEDAEITFEVRHSGIAHNATDNGSDTLADQTSAYIRFNMPF